MPSKEGKKVYYAICQSDHTIWKGNDRATQEEAREDAKNHDDNEHGGKKTAGVLSGRKTN